MLCESELPLDPGLSEERRILRGPCCQGQGSHAYRHGGFCGPRSLPFPLSTPSNIGADFFRIQPRQGVLILSQIELRGIRGSALSCTVLAQLRGGSSPASSGADHELVLDRRWRLQSPRQKLRTRLELHNAIFISELDHWNWMYAVDIRAQPCTEVCQRHFWGQPRRMISASTCFRRDCSVVRKQSRSTMRGDQIPQG